LIKKIFLIAQIVKKLKQISTDADLIDRMRQRIVKLVKHVRETMGLKKVYQISFTG